jgi:hypothetical protein
VAKDENPAPEPDDETAVYFKRYQEARREAGLTIVEARLWAESDGDTGVLRQLYRNGCKPELIARIVI